MYWKFEQGLRRVIHVLSSEKIITKKNYYKKNNYYKKIWARPPAGLYTFGLLKRLLQKNHYYKIENFSKASGVGLHVLSSEKIITTKKVITKTFNYYRFYYKLKIWARPPAGVYTFCLLKSLLQQKKVITKKILQVLLLWCMWSQIFVRFALSLTVFRDKHFLHKNGKIGHYFKFLKIWFFFLIFQKFRRSWNFEKCFAVVTDDACDPKFTSISIYL